MRHVRRPVGADTEHVEVRAPCVGRGVTPGVVGAAFPMSEVGPAPGGDRGRRSRQGSTPRAFGRLQRDRAGRLARGARTTARAPVPPRLRSTVRPRARIPCLASERTLLGRRVAVLSRSFRPRGLQRRLLVAVASRRRHPGFDRGRHACHLDRDVCQARDRDDT